MGVLCLVMADEGTFATTAEVQYKAGANASTTSNVEAYINVFIKQAESYINVTTRYNWHDAYSGLNEDVKHILKEAASNLAAVYVIQYDMTGFFGRNAQTMISLLLQRFEDCVFQLLDKKREDFIVGE